MGKGIHWLGRQRRDYILEHLLPLSHAFYPFASQWSRAGGVALYSQWSSSTGHTRAGDGPSIYASTADLASLPIYTSADSKTVQNLQGALPTSSSLIATQLFDGNPWSMGTRNWRQPDQWPTKSIMQIRLNMRMNTLAMFRNWKRGNRCILIPPKATIHPLSKFSSKNRFSWKSRLWI